MKLGSVFTIISVFVVTIFTPYPATGGVQYDLFGLDMVRASGVYTQAGEIRIVGVDQPPGSFFQGAWQTVGNGNSFMGTLPNGIFSEAYAVRDVAVGSSHFVGLDGFDRVRAFTYDHTTGVMTSLDNISDLSEAYDLNDSHIVGTADYGTAIAPRPTAWDRATGAMTPIGNVTRGSANAINNNDQVVGNVVHNDGSGVRQAFRLLNGLGNDAELLNIPNALESIARDINDSGVTVGTYFDLDTGASHAFIWRADGTVESPGTPGGSSKTLNCINASGLMGGQYLSPTGPRAYIIDPILGPMDLTDLIDPTSGWTLTEITGITDEGHLVGYGINADGHTQGFAAILVPSPSTGIALAAFATVVGIARRRR